MSARVAEGLASLMRSREVLGASGAVAVVVGDNESLRRAAEQAAAGAPAGRPFRVFDDVESARHWLDRPGL